MNARKFCLAVCALLASVGASANEVALVSDVAKSGAAVHAVDFFSNGDGVGFEIRIDVPGAASGSVDVSKCAKELPKTHVGSCVFNGKQVVILGYSMENALLPVGLIDLGTFSVGGSSIAKAAGPVVETFIVGDAVGSELSSKIVAAQ